MEYTTITPEIAAQLEADALKAHGTEKALEAWQLGITAACHEWLLELADATGTTDELVIAAITDELDRHAAAAADAARIAAEVGGEPPSKRARMASLREAIEHAERIHHTQTSLAIYDPGPVREMAIVEAEATHAVCTRMLADAQAEPNPEAAPTPDRPA